MPRVRASQELDPSELRRYAAVGAQARLEAIASEMAAIRHAFPELANGSVDDVTTTTAATSPSRHRRTMSAAHRKAVGKRMRKYWAARQAGNQGTQSESQTGVAAAAVSRKGRRSRQPKPQAMRGARKMSAAARKRISEAQKARWAKQKRAAS